MARLLRWLHLSDFHLKEAKSYDHDLVLKALVKSIGEFYDKNIHRPDIVFATGDIGNFGKPGEYTRASKLFEDILAALHLSKDRLFVIPGNHDIDRSEGEDLKRTLESATKADTFFGTPKSFAKYAAKQAAFLEWHDSFFQDIRTFPSTSTCSPIINARINGISIGIGLINAALFCQDDHDEGKLWVGRRCLDEAYESFDINSVDLSIALIHHPFDWLHHDEQSEVETRVCDLFDVILSGHLHEANARNTTGVRGEALQVTSGAAYQGSEWPNLVFYGTADLETAKLTLHPIHFVRRPRALWVLDTSVFPRQPRNEGEFQLTKREPKPIPILVEPPIVTQVVMPPAPSSAPEPNRNNLPRHKNPFVGRVSELEKVAKNLEPTRQSWGILLDGPGGMGKTAIALEAAHRASDTQFPRKVFLTAKKRQLLPDGVKPLSDFSMTDFDAIVTELGRWLGAEQRIRGSAEEQTRQLLQALGEVPTLLVLDNIEDLSEADHIRLYDFVSYLPQGCKAIVTGRRREGLQGITLRVSQLSEEDALGMLEGLAETNAPLAKVSTDDRKRLIHEAGGNPLILTWLAGQLDREKSRCRTVAEACAYLAKAPANNDPLEYVFGDLLDTFTEDETAALAALTHFTTPANFVWLAEMTGVPPIRLERALDDLTNRSLVEAVEEGTQYRILRIAVEYLKRVHAEIVARTGKRLEDAVYALVVENGYYNYDKFPVLRENWPRISASLPRFLRGDNRRLQTVCSALSEFTVFAGLWQERIWFFEAAEQCAIAAEDFSIAGWRAHDAGFGNSLLGNGKAVLACAERVETYWAQAKPVSTNMQAATIRLRGIGYGLLKNYSEAISSYEESLRLHKTLATQSKDVASSLNNLAEAHRLSGHLDQAEAYFSDAINMARTLEHQQGVAAYTGNLALVALSREDWTKAETLARESLQLSMVLERDDLIASNNSRLAKSLTRQGKTLEALPFARRGVELYERLSAPNLAWARAVLAECEAALRASS